MKNDAEDHFRFILEEVLRIKDSRFIHSEIEKRNKSIEWKVYDEDEEIIFLSPDQKKSGSSINTTVFRKLYTGARRRKLSIIHVQNHDDDITGVFSRKAISLIWKLAIKERLASIELIPFEEEPYKAKYLQLQFQSGIFLTKGIHQLFPTDEYIEDNIEIAKNYAKAKAKFRELVPFKINRIIDLLSTDEIAPSYESWLKDPLKYDLRNVDTADLTAAKKIADGLPDEELNLLVKDIREIITEIELDEVVNQQGIERYSQFLKYVKKIRKIKKKKGKE